MANPRTGESFRVANLFHVRGKELIAVNELVAGDIGVVSKLDDVKTGDTLTTSGSGIVLDPPVFPRPLYSVAVSPATKADSAKMGQAMQSLTEEDPTIKVQTISATKQNLVQGMGDVHVDVNIRRLESKFGVNVRPPCPRFPTRKPSPARHG